MASKKAAGPKVADRARTGRKAKPRSEAATSKAIKAARAEMAENIERIDAGDGAIRGATSGATAAHGATDGPTPAPGGPDATGANVAANAGPDVAPTANPAKGRKTKSGHDSKRGAGKSKGTATAKSAAAGTAGNAAKPARTPKSPREKKPRRMSALAAAAKVLAASDAPMRSAEMIAAMQRKGLWTSPGGKTPEATLYAAIIRDIAAKGSKARFKKHERGVFVATTNAGTHARKEA